MCVLLTQEKRTEKGEPNSRGGLVSLLCLKDRLIAVSQPFIYAGHRSIESRRPMRKDGVLFGIVQWLRVVLPGISHLPELTRALLIRLASIEFREAVVRGEVFRGE